MPKILTIEEIKNNLFDRFSNDLELIEYSGRCMNNDSLFYCNKCGNKWFSNVSYLMHKGVGCPKCNKTGRKQEIFSDEAEKRLFEKHNGKIIMYNFSSLSEYADFECLVCGRKWKNIARRVIRKDGCINCQHNNDRLSLEYIENYVKSQGCILIDGTTYKNAKSKIFVKFECGHNNLIIWNDFQQGKRCIQCGIQLRLDKHRTKEIDIINFLEKNDLIFIDFPNGFNTQKTSSVRYMCDQGHITERKVDRIYKYPTCKKCKKIYLSKIHRGEGNHAWKGGGSLKSFLRNSISEWKKESFKKYNFKCYITGSTKNLVVHHLISFSKIYYSVLKKNNIEIKRKFNDYSKEELDLITKIFSDEHNKVLGIVITKSIHNKFHKLYGTKNFAPENFYEFADNIRNGKISII